MADETRAERLCSLGEGLEIWRGDIDVLREQRKNAHVMNPSTFDRLTQNIKRNQRIESLPLCAAITERGENSRAIIHPELGPIRIEVVSGHHRIRASRKAELRQIPFLLDVTNLTRSQIVAKQLAHNSINGTDDEDIVAQLFTEMDSWEDMLESHIDPESLGISPALETESLQGIRVQFDARPVTFMFLPSQIEHVNEVLNLLPPDVSEVHLIPVELLERFQKTLKDIGAKFDIKATGAMFHKMTELALEAMANMPVDEQEAEAESEEDAGKRKKKKEQVANNRKTRDAAAAVLKRPASSALAAYRKAKEAAEAEPALEPEAIPEESTDAPESPEDIADDILADMS